MSAPWAWSVGAMALVAVVACGGESSAPGGAGAGGDAATPIGSEAGAVVDAAIDSGTLPEAAPDAGAPSHTGISKVATGEYVTAYLSKGRLYEVAGTAARLGAGDHPPPLFPPAEVAFDPARTIVDAAGGLHVTLATDDQGHVWEWGDATSNPALATSNVPVQITPDATGKDFTLLDGAGHNVRSMAASVRTSVAVKGDGSVWVWDDTTGGLQGDGTPGSSSVTHPVEVPIPLPAGVTIAKAVVSDVVLALASDGTIWAWGGGGVMEDLGTNDTDYTHPHRIATTSTGAPMPPVVDVETGGSFSYALTADGALYTWGLYAEIAGLCPGSGWCPAARPVLSTSTVVPAGSTAHIVSIATNTEASYAVLSDGTLWAWGSNGEGLVGNGVEPDYATANPPYAWDWGKDDLLVAPAVHVAPGVHDFVQVFTGSAFVFYAYAMTADGRLYSWGRNKTGNLGNGVFPLNSQQAATYPNSWDVTTPTEVDPLHAAPKPTSSAECVKDVDAGSCWCAGGPSGPQGC